MLFNNEKYFAFGSAFSLYSEYPTSLRVSERIKDIQQVFQKGTMHN